MSQCDPPFASTAGYTIWRARSTAGGDLATSLPWPFAGKGAGFDLWLVAAGASATWLTVVIFAAMLGSCCGWSSEAGGMGGAKRAGGLGSERAVDVASVFDPEDDDLTRSLVDPVEDPVGPSSG